MVSSDGPYRFLTAISPVGSDCIIAGGIGSPAIFNTLTCVRSAPSLNKWLTTLGTVFSNKGCVQCRYCPISNALDSKRNCLPLMSVKNISNIERSKQIEVTPSTTSYTSLLNSFLHHSTNACTLPWVIITPLG